MVPCGAQSNAHQCGEVTRLSAMLKPLLGLERGTVRVRVLWVRLHNSVLLNIQKFAILDLPRTSPVAATLFLEKKV